jgi:hypothetical protein
VLIYIVPCARRRIKKPRISSTLEMFPERCGGAAKIKEKKDGV